MGKTMREKQRMSNETSTVNSMLSFGELGLFSMRKMVCWMIAMGWGLARWEFGYLDDDLGTKKIQRLLAEKGDWIFEEVVAPPEAREKYQHLFLRT